jgi:hypothetical protein
MSLYINLMDISYGNTVMEEIEVSDDAPGISMETSESSNDTRLTTFFSEFKEQMLIHRVVS